MQKAKRLVVHGKHILRDLIERASGRRKLDPAAPAMKELYAKMRFERPYLLGDRRLTHAELVRPGRKTVVLRYRVE